jgi:poly-beta-1,6-N-acetyl-D-glucosamine synthase
MMRPWLALFWLSAGWLAYVYAGYPLFLWLASFWRRFRPELRDDYLPKVSVLISARNEEKDVGWKVSETLCWNYPSDRFELIIASDASEDRTDDILQSFKDPRLKYVRMESRVGKNEALNRLCQLASGDLIFFTDANSHIASDGLRNIVRYFADPRVGCVTGMEKTLHGEGDHVGTTGTQAYLEYESLISSLESRLGSVLVCDGSIFCIRRELYSPVQADLANDLELPVQIGSRGYALLYEPSARSLEKASLSSREEFNRKRRICAQGILGFWRLRPLLHGLRGWQFISRKLLRWLILFPLLALLLSSALLAARPFFMVCLLLQSAAYAAALFGLTQELGSGRAGRSLGIPYYYVVVHLAAFVGVCEAALGKRFSVWEVAPHTRGPETQRVEAGKT